MGLHFGGHTPSTRGSAATKRGNCIIRAATRRRYSASQLLMLQNPHHSKPEVRRIVYKSLTQHRLVRKNSPNTAPPPAFPRKTRPARHKPPILSHFSYAGRTFSRSRPPSDRAGRTFSRTGSCDAATMQPMTPPQPLMQASTKPPSPLHAPKQQPLKPRTPLQPKNTPKTPISHPQRRWRFQLRHGLRPQRRQGFQTTGPPGLQGPDAIPVAGGGTNRGELHYTRVRHAGDTPPAGFV